MTSDRIDVEPTRDPAASTPRDRTAPPLPPDDERSEAIGDSPAPVGTSPRAAPRPGPDDLLGEIGDSLIHAHRCAKLDGDPLTLSLIETALFHVGRRLARGTTPDEEASRPYRGRKQVPPR